MGAGGPQAAYGVTAAVFGLAAVSILVRFSYLHETLTMLLGKRPFLLYVTGIPTLLALVFSGGLRRVFQESRPVLYWIGFTLWIAITIPFSTWPGGSFHALTAYLKVGPFMLLVIAGMTTTWQQCKGVMWAIAAAAYLNVLSARVFQSRGSDAGRLALDLGSGSIQNPNDFAAHLLLVLPFLLWVVLTRKSAILRLMSLLGIGYGMYVVLRAASRGAALALAVDLAFFCWRGTTRQRIAMLAVLPAAIAVMLMVVPEYAWTRMRVFSTASSAGNEIAVEAAGSAAARERLLRKSFTYTIEHPLFGVGPGQFTTYDDSRERVEGGRGNWLVAHNSFMQVASECGIPGLLLFLGGIISSFRLLNATYREARRRPNCHDIRVAVFCVMLAMAGFCTAAAFLSLGYSFYLPAMAGLAVVLAKSARQEFASRAASPGAVPEAARVPGMAAEQMWA